MISEISNEYVRESAYEYPFFPELGSNAGVKHLLSEEGNDI